jgi:hypothetical protein
MEMPMGAFARRLPESELPIRIAPSMAPDGVVPDRTIVALMVRHIATLRPFAEPRVSGSDILRELRMTFPDCSLALRVAALNAGMRPPER